jgi:hypothetical protein
VTLDELYDQMDLYGFEDFEDEQKLTLLNEAYFDVVTREPWPFLEVVSTFTAPSGTTQITNQSFSGSPTNVNTVLSFIDTTNDVVMTPERGDVIEKNYRINDLDTYPEHYYFVGEELFVYPSVKGSTTYRLFYTRTPVSATETTGTGAWFIPSRHHSIVLYGALVKAFLVNDDPQVAAFQNLFESRYQQMRNDLWVQQYDRTERVHIISDAYDWNY